MQTLVGQRPYSTVDQRHAYQIRAFGPLLDELQTRIAALRCSGSSAANVIARKLDRCCTEPAVISVDQGTRYYLAEARCKSRVCPRCSRIRAKSLSTRIAKLVRLMEAPRFLTLTVRSTDASLAEQVKLLRRRFATMRRRPEWTDRVTGGVYTVEITFNAETERWHPHLHAIIDGAYFPHRELLQLWERTVGDHAGVDIRAVHGVSKLANYLACYVAKSCDLGNLKSDRLPEWAVATHGLRLAQTFGGIHNAKPQTDPAEPVAIRVLPLDVNDLAYVASFDVPIATHLLSLIEPHRMHPTERNPAEIDRLIADYNDGLPPRPPPSPQPDRSQLQLI
ncbi:MAG: protein rep [Acidobacteria bacterium]|nr:protein rep [Acidobacteriota bacterium]